MTEPPINFDPQQAAPFLEKIARERDGELARIARDRDMRVARILSEAHSESRHLFRRSVEEYRGRLQQEEDRYLARVRSELRRQRWKILKATQDRAIEAIWQRFLQAWNDPDEQWVWCRYWLRQALDRAGDMPLTVVCGAGTHATTRQRLDGEAALHAAGGQVRMDAEGEPGLMIEWGDYTLDGRLRSQCPKIADMVLCRVAHLMRGDPDEECAE